jgi:hypothetical protein
VIASLAGCGGGPVSMGDNTDDQAIHCRPAWKCATGSDSGTGPNDSGPTDSGVQETGTAQNDMGTGADAPNTAVAAVVPQSKTSQYIWAGTGWLDGSDLDDYYTVNSDAWVLGNGQRIAVWLTPPQGATYSLEILDPNGQVIANNGLNGYTRNGVQIETFVPPVAGNYLVHVHSSGGSGTYGLYIGVGPVGTFTPDMTFAKGGVAINWGDPLSPFSGTITVSGTDNANLGLGMWTLAIWPESNIAASTFLNQTVVNPPTDPATLTYQFDTTKFPNGTYNLMLNAVDGPGSGSSLTLPVYIQN